jgi:glycosyltransferase involved in cell wall biosynthesis
MQTSMNQAAPSAVAMDVTALIWQPVTGIQRVIHELLPRLCRSCFDRGLGVTLGHSLSPRFVPICRWDAPVTDAEIAAVLKGISSGNAVWPRSWLTRWLGCAKRATCLVPGVITWARGSRVMRLAAKRLRQFLVDYLTDSTVVVGPDIDSFIGFSVGILPTRLPDGINPRRVLLVVHDLIPLRYPEYEDAGVPQRFWTNVGALAFPYQGRPTDYRFITPSAAVAADVRSFFGWLWHQPPAVRPVYWGINRDRFFPEPDAGLRKQLGVPEGNYLVLAVSAAVPRKRFHVVEEALALLNRHLPVTGLFIGPRRPTASPASWVRHLGFVEDGLLRRAYSSCNAFVNWSACEGFGLPIIEALACGAPVVVPPDNPVLLEIGGPDVTVAESATADGLARTLAQALRKPPCGKPADLRRFDWERAAGAIVDELWTSASLTRAA